MRQILKHSSTAALIIIVLILLVPSWRVSFQGWFQGLFMGDMVISSETSIPLTIEVENWVLKDLDGNEKSFNAFADKPIILSFWATWCPPCRAELKELNALKGTFGTTMHFISASEESAETIKNSGLHNDYNFLFSTLRYPAFFNVQSYPTLCLIDKNRNLIFRHDGAGGLDNEKNKTFLKDLIENQ